MTNRPDGLRAWLTADSIGIASAITVATAIGAALVARPGYGPDEEITWFAVEGIKAHGIPILPSGLAYFRGPAYSYLAWLSDFASGAGFEAYRWVGVVCLAAVILATALLARSLFDRGMVAAWLIALAPVTVASGAFARFYMPFAAVCTLTLILAARLREDPRMRAWFVVGCVAARSLHEFGMLLALVPAAGWLCAESAEERRSFAWLFVVTAAALVTEHTVLLWLPCLAWNCQGATWGFSSSGLPTIASMALPVAAFAPPSEIAFAVVAAAITAGVSYRTIRADGLFTIAAAIAAALFANGAAAALVLLWSIARPAHAGKVARAGLLAAAAGSVAWIALVYVRGNALVDARLVWGLLRSSFIFPWSGIQYLLTEQPVVVAAIMLGIWRGAFTRRAIPARMLALLLCLELLSFGVTGMDVRARFLVLIMPLIAVFAGAGTIWLARIAADAVSRRSPLLARIVLVTTVIAAVGYVLAEQAAAIVPHRDPVSGAAWWTRWSPSVALSSLAIDRDIVAPDDLIVTNDELAALLVLGRMDYWWPPDSTSAERYTFTDQRGGQRRGIYGGAAVLPELAAVQLLIQQRQTRAVVVALFNTGKFGFDPSNLLGLIDENHTVELERSNDWFVARFPARP
jgi:hypothetical protein